MLDEYKKLIGEATGRVYEVALKTPLDFAPMLSDRLGNSVWLKREDQQPVFSYKLRGAFNRIATLDEAARNAGVIAASAGNHAQGVALAAQKLAIKAVIVMPKTTPEIKINAVKRFGAKVILHGNTYDEAKDHALQQAGEHNLTFIHPFDHPVVIAGQGTVGVEILEQHPDPVDFIFVPVGGGGLIAGISAWVKSQRPDTRIIGVEPAEAPCMKRAFEAGACVTLEHIGIFADGAAVKRAGEESFRVARENVDEILLVSNDEICAAVKDIFEDTRSIPEPAGALALAGLKQYVKRENLQDRQLVSIFSGANVNFDRLRHIAELSALGEHREALLATVIPERPGSFRQFCHDLGARSITEFNYRYSDSVEAHVFAGVQLRHGVEEKDNLIANLRERGYRVADLSSNEVAKMHIRHMVGGHAPQAKNERLYRFEFPERPGALLHFLNRMGEQWNISLFHYRNHGAAYGRVLMGIQVQEEDMPRFQAFLEELGMQYSAEENNPAYEMFLS